MSTQGIEAVLLTTHNLGKAARFFQALGFAWEFETGHSSGQLRCVTVRTCSSPRSPIPNPHCRSS